MNEFLVAYVPIIRPDHSPANPFSEKKFVTTAFIKICM